VRRHCKSTTYLYIPISPTPLSRPAFSINYNLAQSKRVMENDGK
jgi:hypothetical protein